MPWFCGPQRRGLGIKDGTRICRAGTSPQPLPLTLRGQPRSSISRPGTVGRASESSSWNKQQERHMSQTPEPRPRREESVEVGATGLRETVFALRRLSRMLRVDFKRPPGRRIRLRSVFRRATVPAERDSHARAAVGPEMAVRYNLPGPASARRGMPPLFSSGLGPVCGHGIVGESQKTG